MEYHDNNKLTLIDFEYGGWNPVGYDLANYLNELVYDNNKTDQGVGLYTSNFPSNQEI